MEASEPDKAPQTSEEAAMKGGSARAYLVALKARYWAGDVPQEAPQQQPENDRPATDSNGQHNAE